MTTTVIHVKQAPVGWEKNPDYVYIGRGRGGDLGNPHVIGWCSICCCPHDRAGCIAVFERDVREKMQSAEYRAKVESLRGKYLVCFCAPKKCHGDVYVALLEST